MPKLSMCAAILFVIYVCSRTIVPLVLRRIWSYWEDYSTNPASTTICVDGDIGTVLKMYREVCTVFEVNQECLLLVILNSLVKLC